MSTNLGNRLPASVQALLSGDRLQDKAGTGFLLVSQSEDGFPHACILSPGEVLASDSSTLRLALAAQSSTARNLQVRAAAMLCFAADGAAYYIKGEAMPVPAPPGSPEGIALFLAPIRTVLEDREPSAIVTSGFHFNDHRNEATIHAQWNASINAMRQAKA